MISYTFLLSLVPLTIAAVNGPCSIDGTPGVCVTTSDCAAADGSYRSGFCPNDPADVKCCIKPECGSGGNCRPTSSCTGTTKAGLCPGPSDFKCCEPNGGGGGGGGSAGDYSLSANGVDFIAGFEGFEPNFYTDAAVSFRSLLNLNKIFADLTTKGVRTIGYGHACQTAGECDGISAPITKAEGKTLLNSDADAFEACVNKDVTVAVSLTYMLCSLIALSATESFYR